MTRVDFYILPDAGGDDAVAAACKLCDKAVGAGSRVYVNAPEQRDQEAIDKLLWTLRQGSFLSHERYAGTAIAEPVPQVLLGNVEPPESHNQVLINLAADVPPYFSRFERVLEVVPGGEARALSRTRWKFYKDRGYELKSFEQQPDGGWKARA